MSSFHFPIPYILANDRVKLIPFEPDLHSVALVAQLNAYPELLAHMPGEPFRSIKELKALLQTPSNSLFSLPNPAHLLFAIIDKTSQTPSPEDEEGQLAGTIAYMNASKSDRSVEIGFVSMFLNGVMSERNMLKEPQSLQPSFQATRKRTSLSTR